MLPRRPIRLCSPFSIHARPRYIPSRLLSNLPPQPSTSAGEQESTTSAKPSTPDGDGRSANGRRLDELSMNAKQYAREWSIRNITALKESRDTLVSQLSTTFSRLGGEINHVTGYQEIEALKRRVVEQEALIDAARNNAREAKLVYEQAVQQRSNSQREVNELLGRKSTWADSDVSRFTALVRQDHLHEQEEARAKAAVQESEDAVERAFSDLTRSILGRYHEEQIWSDKIRSLSTYGSLAVLGVNLLVFIVAILLVEPWKRRRLVQEFERKVEELTQTNLSVWQDSMKGLEGRLDAQQQLLDELSAPPESLVSALAELGAAEEVIEKAETHIEKDRYWAVRDKDMAIVMASTATAAAALGWLARSWYR